ncbi:YcgL domain [Actinobacillus equuli]|nr:YcgL domain [Actinobacillus equuli]
MSTNLCAIYKSPKREGMFLYVAKRDQFDSVPEELRQMFGKPQFVMLFNLNGEKQLKRSKTKKFCKRFKHKAFLTNATTTGEFVKTFLEQNRGDA